MDFRRSVNRALNTESTSGTADAVIATSQDALTRQERLEKWKEERTRTVLKPRNDQNAMPASQNTNKPSVKKTTLSSRKSRATMGPASFAANKANRRTTTMRRSSDFSSNERVLKARQETTIEQENRPSMATTNPLPPSAFTPSRFVPSSEDALLIARTPSSPDEYAVDIVHKLRSQVAKKDAIIARLEAKVNNQSTTTFDQNIATSLQQELDQLHSMAKEKEAEHERRVETLEKDIRDEYQSRLYSMEQELELAHKEIEQLRQERQQAWPMPETAITPTRPYLKRSSSTVDMVPRAELTEAVFARELAEANLRDNQAETQELQNYITECASMIEEMAAQQQALETAIEEKSEQIDDLMNRCMVAEFRVNEVDNLVNERDQLQEQLTTIQHELIDSKCGRVTGNSSTSSNNLSQSKASIQTQTDRKWNKVQQEMLALLEENRQLRLKVEKDAHTYQQAVTTLNKQRETSDKEWQSIMDNTVSMREETMNCLAEKVRRCQELSALLKEANATIETLNQVISVTQESV